MAGKTHISIEEATAALAQSASDQDPAPAAEAQSATTPPEDGAAATPPSVSESDQDPASTEEPEAQSAASDDGESAPGPSVGGFVHEDDVPEGLRPMWRSAQATITRTQQDLAEQRRQVEAQRTQLATAADLAEGLRAIGLDPAEFNEQIRQVQANPQLLQPQFGATETTASASGDPLEAVFQQDEHVQAYERNLARLTARQEDASTDVEVDLLQSHIDTLALQMADRKQAIKDAHEQTRAAEWQQQRSRSQAIQTELSRLEADQTLQPHLTDPRRKNSLLGYAERGEVPLEVVAKGLAFDDALAKAQADAYKQGRADGVQGRNRSKDASVQQGRPTAAASPDTSVRYRKGMSMMDMVKEGMDNGSIRLEQPR